MATKAQAGSVSFKILKKMFQHYPEADSYIIHCAISVAKAGDANVVKALLKQAYQSRTGIDPSINAHEMHVFKQWIRSGIMVRPANGPIPEGPLQEVTRNDAFEPSVESIE